MEQVKRIVWALAWRYSYARRCGTAAWTSADVEDIAQDGWLGALHAWERFKPGSSPFPNWAYKRINGAMVDGLRRRKKGAQRRMDVKETIGLGASGLEEMGGFEPSVSTDVMEAKVEVAHLLASGALSDRERRVVVAYWLEGYTLREVGEEVGVSESRVCQMMGEIFVKLTVDTPVSA
jgi:RNA polymerase sigma factor FliA